MPRRLPADCLNDIFEYLEDEALRSCLLVDRLWCETSVPILWKNIQNYHTLIACLPNESKEVLYKNEIVITTPTSKPLLFNYVSFVKRLSIDEIEDHLRKNQLVLQEVFKMVMSQTSLKILNLRYWSDL